MKTPQESLVVINEMVFPNDANPVGVLHGGRLMQWMDTACAICSQLHSNRICVTASIDSVAFKKAINVGDIVTIKAKITRVFATSLEILVEVSARKRGIESSYLTNTAYFTFVALDDDGKPVHIQQIIPVTKEEKYEFENALLRKMKHKNDIYHK